jgi:hypothetical protein
MYGFFNNKRIVLYDTLISQCSEEQVVAVLAHELGERGWPGLQQAARPTCSCHRNAAARLFGCSSDGVRQRAVLRGPAAQRTTRPHSAGSGGARKPSEPLTPAPAPPRAAGHWKLRHTPTLFVVGQLIMLSQFSLFAVVRSSEQVRRLPPCASPKFFQPMLKSNWRALAWPAGRCSRHLQSLLPGAGPICGMAWVFGSARCQAATASRQLLLLAS